VKLLIDGDVFLFTICQACEREIEWNPDDFSNTIHLDEAKSMFYTAVEGLKESLCCETSLIALSGDRSLNWRRKVLPGYKSNRSGRKPTGYKALENWVRQIYNTKSYPTLEADDVLGIEQTSPQEDRTIIVSSDKDMFTLPGLFARLDANSLTTYTLHQVSDDLARRSHFTQTLTGDKTDGYPGCPGIGEKTAEKVLVDGTWQEVKLAFEKAGLSEEVALQNARVARILHGSEYNVKTGKVTLWNPSN